MSNGMHEEQIYSLLREHQGGLTIENVSQLLQISRTTAARYLESLYCAGKAERRVLGPAKIYRAASRIHSSNLLSILTEGVIIVDREGVIQEVNPSFCTLFSITSEELRGRGIVYTPINELLNQEIIDSLIHPSDSPGEGIIQIHRKGDERYLHYQTVPLLLSNDNLGSALLVFDKTDIITSQVHTKDLEYEYQDELSRIESHFSRNLEKAKTTARESSSRERTVLDLIQNVRAFIMKINKAGNVVFCNNYASEISGLNDVEHEPRILLDSLFPTFDEYGVNISDSIREVRNGTVSFSRWESPLLIHNNLSSSIYSWNLISIKKGKQGVSLILAGVDITDLITHERQVIQSKKQMEWILNHLPDPTFAIDKRKQVIFWNKQMELMTNQLSEDVVGRSIDECIPYIYGYNRPVLADLIFDRYDPMINAFFEDVKTEGIAITAETIAYCQDGSKRIYWVKGTPYYDEDNEVVGAIQSIRDITMIRESEEKIRNKEELFRGIAESALDNIIVINREGTILYANQSIGRLLGIGAEQIIGLHMDNVSEIKIIFSDLERIKSVFITGIPTHELFTIRHDSVEMLMDISFIPEKDRNGLISSVLVVLRNISSLHKEISQMGSFQALKR